jgi:HK97 family phage prohead protease
MTMIETVTFAPPEFRSATVADVAYSDRMITVIAVPYDVEAEVWDARHGDYRESFDPRAFNGVERRLSGRDRVTVNRDHDAARLVGKVDKLYPHHRDGLVAKLRMTKGLQLADDTLTLAADDVLGASISFSPMFDGEEWSEDGRSRRVTKARLHHIALTPEPAYRDATVLDVRTANLVGTATAASIVQNLGQIGEAPPPASATPWLDAILAERRMARYSHD